MNFSSIALLALAMSTDAFAAAVGKGTALERPRWAEALRAGLIFGVIEALTPMVGWAIGLAAAEHVKAWDHWIAFALLVGLGVRMVVAGLRPPAPDEPERPSRHSFWVLAATGLATSMDAMAVGAGLALIDVRIVPIAAAIGFTTFAMVTIGIMVGRLLGTTVGRRAEALGGLVLVGMGLAILADHLGGG